MDNQPQLATDHPLLLGSLLFLKERPLPFYLCPLEVKVQTRNIPLGRPRHALAPRLPGRQARFYLFSFRRVSRVCFPPSLLQHTISTTHERHSSAECHGFSQLATVSLASQPLHTLLPLSGIPFPSLFSRQIFLISLRGHFPSNLGWVPLHYVLIAAETLLLCCNRHLAFFSSFD